MPTLRFDPPLAALTYDAAPAKANAPPMNSLLFISFLPIWQFPFLPVRPSRKNPEFRCANLTFPRQYTRTSNICAELSPHVSKHVMRTASILRFSNRWRTMRRQFSISEATCVHAPSERTSTA